jgi:hypothetical protein
VAAGPIQIHAVVAENRFVRWKVEAYPQRLPVGVVNPGAMYGLPA